MGLGRGNSLFSQLLDTVLYVLEVVGAVLLRKIVLVIFESTDASGFTLEGIG